MGPRLPSAKRILVWISSSIDTGILLTTPIVDLIVYIIYIYIYIDIRMSNLLLEVPSWAGALKHDSEGLLVVSSVKSRYGAVLGPYFGRFPLLLT